MLCILMVDVHMCVCLDRARRAALERPVLPAQLEDRWELFPSQHLAAPHNIRMHGGGGGGRLWEEDVVTFVNQGWRLLVISGILLVKISIYNCYIPGEKLAVGLTYWLLFCLIMLEMVLKKKGKKTPLKNINCSTESVCVCVCVCVRMCVCVCVWRELGRELGVCLYISSSSIQQHCIWPVAVIVWPVFMNHCCHLIAVTTV